jgi:hypothetical protein
MGRHDAPVSGDFPEDRDLPADHGSGGPADQSGDCADFSVRDDAPADLAAIARDDALLDRLSAGSDDLFDDVGPWRRPGSATDDDQVTAALRDWRHSLALQDLPPVPELPAGFRPGRARRVAGLRPMIAVAAAIAALLIGIGGVSRSAAPGDLLWPVTRVIWHDHAVSVAAKESTQHALNIAQVALDSDDPTQAIVALTSASSDLSRVSVDDGQVELARTYQSLWVAATSRMQTVDTTAPTGVVPSSTPGSSTTGTTPSTGSSDPGTPTTGTGSNGGGSVPATGATGTGDGTPTTGETSGTDPSTGGSSTDSSESSSGSSSSSSPDSSSSGSTTSSTPSTDSSTGGNSSSSSSSGSSSSSTSAPSTPSTTSTDAPTTQPSVPTQASGSDQAGAQQQKVDPGTAGPNAAVGAPGAGGLSGGS